MGYKTPLATLHFFDESFTLDNNARRRQILFIIITTLYTKRISLQFKFHRTQYCQPARGFR